MMRKLLIILSLIFLTACSAAPLRDTHVIERYGEPDEIVLIGPTQQDARTGIYHNSMLIYNLPLSEDPEHPDQRVIYLMDGYVVGIVVFGADGSVKLEDFPPESMAVYYRKMFNDWVWV